MSSFHNVTQSEMALGQSSSFWEHLWLQTTTQFSGYMLYNFVAVFALVFYSIATMPMVILDVLRPKAFQKFKLQPGVQRSWGDVWGCYKSVVFDNLVAVGPFQFTSYPLMKMLGLRTSLPLPSFGEIIMQLIVYILVEDYLHYWIHRWLHTRWAYENIHYKHHSYTASMSIAAVYAHWAELMVLGFPAFVGPFLVPGHMITFWIWFIFRIFEAADTHSGYSFPWSPFKLIPFYTGPEYHDYHHSGKIRGNFCTMLNYCDRIYGTYKGYHYVKND